jgi:ABC-2 type transport system permease protein
MSTQTLPSHPVTGTATLAPRPGRALTGLAVRQIRRGALIVLAVTAGMSALVATTYDSVIADPATARALGALAANPAIRTLFGEPVALDDPGGFTVWRTGTVVAVIVGVWCILATTRITRGEEDAGRWDALLAGRTPLPAVLARHLAVLLCMPVLTGTAITIALLLAGTGAAGAAVHGAGIAALGVFFTAAAASAAQVFAARSAATGAATALLGIALLARMIGDGVTALAWLRWTSPFGLLELARPYAQNRWLPLLVLVATAAALLATARITASRRDVGGGLITPASGRPPRMRLLGSVETFAVRRTIRPLAGWATAIGAYFLLIGLIAESMTGFLSDNPTFADLAAQAGFAALNTTQGYTATLFALLAIPVGIFTAVRLAEFAALETNRRLTLLAAQPLHRHRLLGAEIAATAGGAIALATVAGLATWLGVAVTGGDLSPTAALAGTWNVLPIAALCLGAAVLALGWAPRTTGAIGALPAAGGFLLQAIGQSVGAPPWVIDLSPFAHLSPVPLATVNGPAMLAMSAIAVALTVMGGYGYQRRDLKG